MGRLVAVTKDGTLVEEYQYSLNGSREYEMNSLRGIAGRTLNYSDEDHLLTAGDVSYQYDLDGFLTQKGSSADTTSYSYSSRGELIDVNLPDGKYIEYEHDPLGRRIAKRVNGAIVEKYLWQGLTRLLAVYDGSNNLIQRFEYADGRMPVAMIQGGATYYLSYNQVGSLCLVADSSGNVVKRIEYDSFGNIIEDTNPDFKVPFGFAGGLLDIDTGLVRFGHRDYDPEIGRWTAKDPILFEGGDTDLYGYVLNDPINFVDPLGLLLSDTQIANIIFNETRSFSGENVAEARRDIAHVIINGDNALGDNRPVTAPTTANVPPAEASTYSACSNAVSTARAEREWTDPTNGATNFNFRNNDSTAPFYGLPNQTHVGPLNNSYTGGGLNATGVWVNTYGGRP